MKKQPVKELKYVTLTIVHDNDAANPRDEFDTLSTFYGPRGTRYNVGGQKDIELESWSLPSYVRDFKREGAVIVPFTSNAGECYAIVERSAILKEYKGYSLRSALYHARQVAKGEIAEYLAWANGEVYGYLVTDKETGEHLDSCWGFYGRDFCQEEGQRVAENIDAARAAKEAEVSARLEEIAA